MTDDAEGVATAVAPGAEPSGVLRAEAVPPRTRIPGEPAVAALARAHRWLNAIRAGRDIAGLARADGISEGCLRVHLQLALLAPAIQKAILDGTQPEGLTLNRLTRPEMPADWQAQSRRAGIRPA